jgi:hypothetical protein
MTAAVRIAATLAGDVVSALMPRLLHSIAIAMVPMMAMADDLVAAAVPAMMTMTGELT